MCTVRISDSSDDATVGRGVGFGVVVVVVVVAMMWFANGSG